MTARPFHFLVLLALLFTGVFTWAEDNDPQVPYLVSQVTLPRADATALVVREHGGRTELLIQHADGTTDSVDVTHSWSPKLTERVPWPSSVRIADMSFVGQTAVGIVRNNCPNSADADRDLVLLDSSAESPKVLLRFEHTRDQKLNGDFLYVLTPSTVSIVRLRPEPDPAALASLYGG